MAGSPELPAPPAQFPIPVAAALATRPSSNNHLEYLADRAVFPELERTVAGAQRSIWISVYNWRMDETGLRIADLLARKVRAGLDVHVLVDEFGQGEQRGDRDMLPWLQGHGIDARHYRNKVVFPHGMLHFSHRKLYLVDGDRALTGGMNLGHEYELLWHDLLVKLEGELASHMHREFLRDWRFSGGKDLRVPPLADRPYGRVTAAAIATSPHEAGRGDEIHRVLLTAIRGATRRIWAVYPYWGDEALIETLGLAAKRGVDVRAIVPFDNDVAAFKVANRFVIRELLARGVKVRWFANGFAHAKYMVVDDMTAIGSSNGDTSSFQYQQELDVITPDAAFTEQFVAQIPATHWERDCREVSPQELETPWHQAPTESFLRLVRRYL
jgi:cardiolipin synthase